MKKFAEPEMEVVELQVEDVITTSLPEVEDGLGWG